MNILKQNKFYNIKLIEGSKSINNRYLFFSLYFSSLKIKDILISNDTKRMIEALEFLGFKKYIKKNQIELKYNKKNKEKYLNIENAGTVARPLLVYFLFNSYKDITLDGNKNMRKRPIKNILKLINFLGKIKKRITNNSKKFLPLSINKGFLKFKRSFIFINESKSSQYITAIILNSCLIEKNFFFFIKKIVSFCYLNLTLKLLKKIKLKYIFFKKNIIYYNNYKNFKKIKFKVEKDTISASYFILNSYYSFKKLTLLNFIYKKIQNESCLINIIKNIGFFLYYKKYFRCVYYKKKIYFLKIDCKKIIDFSMTLTILSSKNIKKIFLYNISNWKYKECNRIKAISKEIKKTGKKVYYNKNWIYIVYKKDREKLIIESYNDHRISMLFNNYITKYNCYIKKPNSVKKTFPKYYD
ncbi:hypothetical protein ACWNYI_00575 [Candidatus Vidania fulgoroideorum]